MRPENLYLEDMQSACTAIKRFLKGVSFSKFKNDEVLQSAVLQKLTVIGEASARISVDTRNKHPEIDWGAIVAFRNIAVHEYFSVDQEMVWSTVKYDVSDLSKKLKSI